ncbi:MAG TPA: hypothetical protein VHW65_13630 [Gemmatimonadales bacterium]|jgi:hypothetical protein|nr:hypothetical protein [Gemmatimonadales bacterium]
MPNRFLTGTCAAAIATLLMATAPLPAQGGLGVVIQGDYAENIAGSTAPGIGAGVRFPLGYWSQRSGMFGEITADWFFPDNYLLNGVSDKQTYFEMNFNGVIDLKPVKAIFVGTGINFSDQVINTGNFASPVGGSELGINLIGGLTLGNHHGAPFVQARYELGGGKQWVFSGGFHF